MRWRTHIAIMAAVLAVSALVLVAGTWNRRENISSMAQEKTLVVEGFTSPKTGSEFVYEYPDGFLGRTIIYRDGEKIAEIQASPMPD